MKKILTASLVAILAVTAANADIATTGYVNKQTGMNESGQFVFRGDAQGQTNLTEAVNAVADKVSQLSADVGEGGSVSQQIGSAIQGLTGEVSGTGVVTAISQTNGKVTATLEKIGDDQVNAISTSKITGLDTALSEKQVKGDLVVAAKVADNKTSDVKYPSVAATYSIVEEGIGSLTGGDISDIKSTIGAVDATAYSTATGDPNVVASVTSLQDDLGTVTSENMGTDADNVAGAIKEVVAEKADKATTLAGYGIGDAYTKTETDAAITTKVETLDVTDAAVAGEYVSAVSEADGKISVTRAALTPVAKMNVPTDCTTKLCALVYDKENSTEGNPVLKWEVIAE